MRQITGFLLMIILFVGCGKKEASVPSKSSAVLEDKKVEESLRDDQIRGSINAIAREQFPDNEKNTWEIKSVSHEGDISYVEAVPSPDDIGYPSFIFALYFKDKTTKLRCVATYCMHKGKYSLLSLAPNFDREFPKER